MDHDKKRSDSNKMFDSLVRNALDFLQRSVKELQESPKYSVIDFCTAIELFLKARLLVEHWVLVLENLDAKQATLSNFRQGDFKSVGTEAAFQRLEKLLGLQIDENAKKVFKQIRDHRNSLIHFFHPTYAEKPDSTAIQSVIAEQCRGWFYLHPLLTKTWRNFFASYLSDIELINLAMLHNRAFLRVKFEALSQDIEKGKARGIVFLACEACGFDSARVATERLIGPLFSVECLVCNNQGRVFQIQCPNCSNNTIVHNLFMSQPDRETYALDSIEVPCKACPTLIKFEDILNMYPPFDPDESSPQFLALCGNYCLHTNQKSAVHFGDKWVCLSCCEVETEVWDCDNCGQLFTGEYIGPVFVRHV
jgi:hypothetical protein